MCICTYIYTYTYIYIYIYIYYYIVCTSFQAVLRAPQGARLDEVLVAPGVGEPM